VVKFSPDGRWLFSGGRDFGIHIWDMQDNALKDTYPDLFSPFTFSPDSDKIAIASITGDVDVLNLESGDTIMLPLEDTARTLRFDSDGKTLNAVAQVDAPGGAISFHSWNAASGEPLQSGRPVKVDSGLDFPHCAIFADHQRVAISHFQKRKKFGIFDFETGEEVDVVEVENRSNTVTALSLESGSGDIWFTLWADRIMRKRGSKVEEVIITPNEAKSLALCEKYVAIGLADGRIYIYDRETCGVLMVLSGHLDDVNQLAFSYDGSRLVSASEDRTLRLWSLPARREITVLHAENNWSRLEFSPDGKIFAASGWGGGIQLWRAPDLNEIDAKKSLFR